MVGWEEKGGERSERRKRGGRFYCANRSDAFRTTFVHGCTTLHGADLAESGNIKKDMHGQKLNLAI